MDAQKLGVFICKLRKEQGMTQAELAQKIHVTDKAVSKWERGIGLPDINLLEALAEALNITILELIRSEKMQTEELPMEAVSSVIADTIDMVKEQRKRERQIIIRLCMAVVLATLMICLVDTMGWLGFVGVVLPLFFFLASIVFAVCCAWRIRKKLPISQMLIGLGVSLAMLLGFFLVFFVVGLLGVGPVPT